MGIYAGGCSCGSVRFELNGDPAWVLACHCNACKKRTGSAYGISVMVADSSVKAITGQIKTFRRKGDSGKEVRYDFCPECGTTIRWFVEYIHDRQSFAGGAFDDFSALAPIAEIYTDDAAPWARLGCELSRGRSPDNEFRSAMVNRQRDAAR